MGCRKLQLPDYFQLVENDQIKYRGARFRGNPILASRKGAKTQSVLFNDMLGTTLGQFSTHNSSFSINSTTAFGEPITPNAQRTPTNAQRKTNNELFFTGQIELAQLTKEPATESEFTNGNPKIEGLGYAFLFRNYRSELGKRQTADPLGYPDGWNNLAYVNNGVTGYIDRLGQDIYHVNAPLAVGTSVASLGHSAAIVGNPTFGYRIINHGTATGIGSTMNGWEHKFNTLSDALRKLNEGRHGDEAFTRIQRFQASPAQDDIAYQTMLNSAAKGYNSTTNNCVQVVLDGIIESGIAVVSPWIQYPNQVAPEGKFRFASVRVQNILLAFLATSKFFR